jgi:hypothetical protein
MRVFVVCMMLWTVSLGVGLAQAPEPAEANKPDDEIKKSYLIPAIEIIGFNFALNRFGKRYVDHDDFNVGWNSIRRNLKGPWVVDEDEFQINQFQHPYQGAISHSAARSSGLGYWTSAIYTFAGSALWEIAGETTPPSRNDQVASGIGGSFLGEPLFRMASLTLEKGNGLPKFWRALGATAISPPVGFNRLVFGGRFDPVFPGHEPDLYTRWDFGTTVGEHRVEGTSTRAKRRAVTADFSMAYGTPGKPYYEYRRPFDYFDFEFTATTSNAFENILVRGLLAGKGYGSGNYSGVWGLYGTYDYMAPEVFRMSSTALSGGTTGNWKLPKSMALQSTALAGLGYGAGGTVEGGDERDYHYGLTPQALLSFRLLFGKAATLDVSGRGYQITRFASTNGDGWENIGRADAALTVRLFGPHALTVKYLVTRRNAHFPDVGVRDQRRGTVSVHYSIVGNPTR